MVDRKRDVREQRLIAGKEFGESGQSARAAGRIAIAFLLPRVRLLPGANHRERVLSGEEEKKYLEAATAIGHELQESYRRALEGIRAVQRGEALVARFRVLGEYWEYLALPGAFAYFLDGELHLSTRHYLRGKDYDRISTALEQELLVEEGNLHVIKQSLHNLEEEMFKRLWKLERRGESL